VLIIYDEDSDFGNIQTIDTTSVQSGNRSDLPSSKIDRSTLSHLKVEQQNELLELLDRNADCFFSTPGLCNVILHEIPTTSGFVPKRLRAYRISDGLKSEVNRQIKELLDLDRIQESNSPMASPTVCVMKKGSNGQSNGVRLCVNYQYVNQYTVPDQIPLPDVAEIIQKVGRAKLID